MSKELTVVQKKRQELGLYLQKVEPKMSCPKHVEPSRITNAIIAATINNPQIALCTPQSVCTAALQAASYGLEPDTALQHAHLVPFRNKKGDLECKLIVGYRGLVTLAYNNPVVKLIETHVVYAGDDFTYEHSEQGTKLRHVPNFEEESPMRLVYSRISLANGGVIIEVMTKRQIDAVKRAARDSSNPKSPWNTSYEEMSRKTTLRRGLKMVPLSPENRALINALADESEQWEEVKEAKGYSESKAEALKEELAVPSNAEVVDDEPEKEEPPIEEETPPEPQTEEPDEKESEGADEGSPKYDDSTRDMFTDYTEIKELLKKHSPLSLVNDNIRTAIHSMDVKTLKAQVEKEIPIVGADGWALVLNCCRASGAIPKGDPKNFKKDDLKEFLAGLRIVKHGVTICRKMEE